VKFNALPDTINIGHFGGGQKSLNWLQWIFV